MDNSVGGMRMVADSCTNPTLHTTVGQDNEVPVSRVVLSHNQTANSLRAHWIWAWPWCLVCSHSAHQVHPNAWPSSRFYLAWMPRSVTSHMAYWTRDIHHIRSSGVNEKKVHTNHPDISRKQHITMNTKSLHSKLPWKPIGIESCQNKRHYE